jgi:hypothetical protein
MLMRTIAFVALLTVSLVSCTQTKFQKAVGTIFGTDPTESEAAGGLKEALIAGAINSTGMLSKQDGFFGNQLVKIPWPEEAKFAADALKKIGMQGTVDKVTLSLNRAAEKASAEAKDVFIAAIKQMTFQDAMGILLGGEGAATDYLRRTTTPILTEKIRPIIDRSLGEVNATQYWGEATTVYNKIPFARPVETDLTAYVTERALRGVFVMLEKEENKIRKDPMARSSELMKKVFGFADKKK